MWHTRPKARQTQHLVLDGAIAGEERGPGASQQKGGEDHQIDGRVARVEIAPVNHPAEPAIAQEQVARVEVAVYQAGRPRPSRQPLHQRQVGLARGDQPQMERAAQLFPRLRNAPVEVKPAEGVAGKAKGHQFLYRESVERGQKRPKGSARAARPSSPRSRWLAGSPGR